ncbi:MAG: ABC transporter permease [Candidatus Saccharimonas sp.]
MADMIIKLRNRYRYSLVILKQLVITEFKLRYKGSVLGYIWTLLKPLALFAVMYVVFIHFLKFGADVPHFAVYLLLGTVLWNFFAEATVNGMSAIVSKGDLMRKLSFPRYVLVISTQVSALINLMINLIVVCIFVVINGVDIDLRALLIIPIIIELSIFSLAIAFFLAALSVKLRDVGYIWELILQAGFYATPIFYPLSMVMKVSTDATNIMMLNPMAQIIQDARFAIISTQTPTVWTIIENPIIVWFPLLIVAVMFVTGSMYFKKKSPYFAEEV